MMDARLAEAKARGAHLIAFPEVSLSGYVLDPAEVRARALDINSPAVAGAVALSAKHSTYYGFGLFEKCGADIYNSFAVAGQGRLIGVARKVHVPYREAGLFTAGSAFKVFDLPFVKLGISICYDNEFPESHTCLAVQGAELIVMPAAWAEHWERERYIEHCSTDDEVVRERQRWATMMFGARCRDTGTYSALINHSGIEAHGPWRFVGKSMILAPTGRVLAEARAWDAEILCADLSARLLADYRDMPCYTLRSRNPEAYGPLVSPAALPTPPDHEPRATARRGDSE